MKARQALGLFIILIWFVWYTVGNEASNDTNKGCPLCAENCGQYCCEIEHDVWQCCIWDANLNECLTGNCYSDEKGAICESKTYYNGTMKLLSKRMEIF